MTMNIKAILEELKEHKLDEYDIRHYPKSDKT